MSKETSELSDMVRELRELVKRLEHLDLHSILLSESWARGESLRE
ncbi:MAG: hypothetical protein ABWJ42_04990 [Sulfolobales archaeon]